MKCKSTTMAIITSVVQMGIYSLGNAQAAGGFGIGGSAPSCGVSGYLDVQSPYPPPGTPVPYVYDVKWNDCAQNNLTCPNSIMALNGTICKVVPFARSLPQEDQNCMKLAYCN
jgi:hypothetical protein